MLKVSNVKKGGSMVRIKGIFLFFVMFIFGFFGKSYVRGQISTSNIVKKNSCEKLALLQQKNHKMYGKPKPSLQQIVWEKERKKLEDQCILESTEETVRRLQAQLEKDRKRWEMRSKKTTKSSPWSQLKKA
jgi:hypothetical protein